LTRDSTLGLPRSQGAEQSLGGPGRRHHAHAGAVRGSSDLSDSSRLKNAFWTIHI
jgi:hypothetical protein